MADPEAVAVRFSEAIAFLRDRLGISEAEWQALLAGVEVAAGDAALSTTEAMHRDLLDAVADALETGETLAAFRDRYDEIATRHGWSGTQDPGWHSELIFRVQIGNAQAAGRWAQVQRVKQQRPYLRYVGVLDARIRRVHRAWHGIVLPVDHPWWRTHYPPNGFNCRCTVQSLNDRDLERWGYAVTPDDDEALTLPPDTGWSGNVGLAWEQLRTS